jgi:hypothetical protein
MKKFARVSWFSAQIGHSSGAESNRRDVGSGFPSPRGRARAEPVTTRLDETNVRPRIADILPMFDATCPRASGDLIGESFASTLENHQRYPSLRKCRDADLLALLDCFVEQRIRGIAELLPGLGFDGAGIAVYKSAALGAFRAALPAN